MLIWHRCTLAPLTDTHQERFAEADKLFEHAVTINKVVFGPDNQIVGNDLQNQADCLQAQVGFGS